MSLSLSSKLWDEQLALNAQLWTDQCFSKYRNLCGGDGV
jgi:hypothetical protein